MNRQYYVRYTPSKSFFDFRYAVYSGDDFPYGRLINVAVTKRGAIRLAKRQQRKDNQPAKPAPQEIVIWRSS